VRQVRVAAVRARPLPVGAASSSAAAASLAATKLSTAAAAITPPTTSNTTTARPLLLLLLLLFLLAPVRDRIHKLVQHQALLPTTATAAAVAIIPILISRQQQQQLVGLRDKAREHSIPLREEPFRGRVVATQSNMVRPEPRLDRLHVVRLVHEVRQILELRAGVAAGP